MLGTIFNFLRRSKFIQFNIVVIGDRWTRLPVTHDGRSGELQLRQLPATLTRGNYRFIALIQPVQEIAPSQFNDWSEAVQRSLESQQKALLVITHTELSQITWYAYSSTREAIDESLSSQMQSHPVRWGINEDARWEEYEFSKKLAGA